MALRGVADDDPLESSLFGVWSKHAGDFLATAIGLWWKVSGRVTDCLVRALVRGFDLRLRVPR